MSFRRVSLTLMSVGVLLATVAVPPATASASTHYWVDCATATNCAEVANSQEVWGNNYHVGHDEPSVLFYSNHPGAGNRMQYQILMPES